MTTKEAIRLMRNLPTMCEFTDAYGEPIDSDAYYEAVDMAISALQAQEAKHSTESSSTHKALDTISRQAAVDAMTDKNITCNMDSVQDSELHRIKRAVHRILASLPSAQTEPLVKESRTLVKDLVKDTISRQAAIDAADRADYTGLAVEDVKKVTDEVVKEIKKLPTAQPEIKPILYQDCANAMMMMWMDDVLTDGEYRRIMDKLNDHESRKENR